MPIALGLVRLSSAAGKVNEDMPRALNILLSLLILPSVSAEGRRSETSKTMAQPVCTLPPGWTDIARRKPRFVIFGEVHGTQEAPDFVGRIACGLVAQGKSVLVAVEHQVSLDSVYQAAWRQPPETFASALLQADWKESRDGKGSVAMLKMLKQLHRLSSQGHAVRLAAFDGERDNVQRRKFSSLPGQGPREAAQAENIRIAADAASYDFVLVLAGNMHASKQPFKRGDTTIEPMAIHLARVGPTVTLDAKYSGGSAWTCELKPGMHPEPGKPLSKDAVECAVHPLGMQPDLGRAPFLSLAASPDVDDAYDGFFWLGTAHGSPPAVRDH